jgi:hypothetical protein
MLTVYLDFDPRRRFSGEERIIGRIGTAGSFESIDEDPGMFRSRSLADVVGDRAERHLRGEAVQFEETSPQSGNHGDCGVPPISASDVWLWLKQQGQLVPCRFTLPSI